MSKSPCNECPFSKKNLLPTKSEQLGGAQPHVYIGQIHGPFWLPCHKDKRYVGKESPVETTQCRGAAIFRANVGVDKLMPQGMLKLESGHPDVFESNEEFLSYYLNITKKDAEFILKMVPPLELTEIELRKNVRVYEKTDKFNQK